MNTYDPRTTSVTRRSATPRSAPRPCRAPDRTSTPWNYRADSGWNAEFDLVGYHVEATDGRIGKIDEASHATDESYLVVDTGPWIFGKKVLIPAGTVTHIDHTDRNVYVDRTKDQVKASPEFDADLYTSRRTATRSAATTTTPTGPGPCDGSPGRTGGRCGVPRTGRHCLLASPAPGLSRPVGEQMGAHGGEVLVGDPDGLRVAGDDPCAPQVGQQVQHRLAGRDGDVRPPLALQLRVDGLPVRPVPTARRPR